MSGQQIRVPDSTHEQLEDLKGQIFGEQHADAVSFAMVVDKLIEEFDEDEPLK